MANHLDDYDLDIDLPTPMTQISIASNDSLRPAPLNFSRPGRSREPSYQKPFVPHDAKRDSGHSDNSSAAPSPNIPRLDEPYDFGFSGRNGRVAEEEEGDEHDEAAPPPVVRTHSNTAHSSFYRPPSNNSAGGPSKTWIYKPYADTSSDADRSSVLTDIPESEDDDSSSIAESTATGHSSVSDFAFDGRLGWNPRDQSHAEKERQRQQWAGPTPRRPVGPNGQHASTSSKESSASNGTTKTNTVTRIPSLLPDAIKSESSNASTKVSGRPLLPVGTNGSTQTTSSNESKSSTKSAPPIPPRIPRIIRRTSLDQMSERVSLGSGDGMSDTASISSSEWKSSDFDTSELSVEQIHKLKKKGINPALYAEMQQAKNRNGKGKKLRIGALTGNTFLG